MYPFFGLKCFAKTTLNKNQIELTKFLLFEVDGEINEIDAINHICATQIIIYTFGIENLPDNIKNYVSTFEKWLNNISQGIMFTPVDISSVNERLFAQM